MVEVEVADTMVDVGSGVGVSEVGSEVLKATVVEDSGIKVPESMGI